MTISKSDSIYPASFSGDGVTAFFTDKFANIDRTVLSVYSNIAPDRIYMPIQRHTDIVLDVTAKDVPMEGDAVVTIEPGLLIGVRAADCVPLLLYDPKAGVIAAVHAGWRGTAAGILKNTINRFIDRYGSDPWDILIAIGPSIRQCCYKVGREVVDSVAAVTGGDGYFRQVDGEWVIDLVAANWIQACSLGVVEGNISGLDVCTSCNTDRYFSYRAAGDKDGRQGGFIVLKT